MTSATLLCSEASIYAFTIDRSGLSKMWDLPRMSLALISTIFACLSLLAVKAEFGAVQSVNAPVAVQLDFLSSGKTPLPLSWSGRRNLLVVCIDVSRSLELQLMPTDYVSRVKATCAELMRQIIESSPTSSEAHLAQALTADPLEAASEGHGGLAIAQSLAPLESWQIRLRSERALDHAAELNVPARQALDADLRLLLATRWGQAWLADLFSQDPARRDVVHAMLLLATDGAAN
jgi:hypothetical protein